MKMHVFKRQTEPGFRLNVVDLLFLLLAFGTSYVASQSDVWAALAPLPIHLSAVFFLFCNVVRVRTRSEIIWMATYAASFAFAISFSLSLWPTVLSLSTASLAAVITHALWSGDHRGVFCRQ